MHMYSKAHKLNSSINLSSYEQAGQYLVLINRLRGQYTEKYWDHSSNVRTERSEVHTKI